jgi:flagellar protein FliO/FliZ
MSRLFFTALVFITGFILNGQEAHGANALSDIATKRIGQDFFVELTFTEDISENGISLDYTNRTIEVNIPSAVAKTKKNFTKINDETVDHLFISQAGEDSLKCRVILNPPNQASQFRSTTAVLSRANKLFVKVVSPPVTGATATASTLPTELPGALIDQLMRKEAGETAVAAVPATAVVTPTIVEKKTAAVAEEAQPVFKTEQNLVKDKNATGKNVWGRMLVSLAFVLCAFGGGLYAFKKWPGSKKLANRSRMIEVLAQHHLGAKRSLAVVKVAGEAVLIGVTDNNITILKSLALLDDDLPAGGGNHGKFNSALANKVQGEISRKATLEEITTSDKDEEFSMRGLREIVGERLKSMREL